MGLDEFKKENIENNTTDDLKEDEVSEDYTESLDVRRGPEETDEEYNTKQLAAIQLKRAGFDVDSQVTLEDEEKEYSVVANLRGELNSNLGGVLTLRDSDISFQEIAVVVGDTTLDKILRLLNYSDGVIWIKRGSYISGSILMTESDMYRASEINIRPHSDTETVMQLSDLEYIDCEGNQFIPDLQGLYVRKYKELAAEMLVAHHDGRLIYPKDILSQVSIDSYEINEEDVIKVLKTIGFR